MLRLTEEANAVIRPLVPELKEFYRKINGEDLGLIQLAIEIEKQFGSRLYEEVCRTIKISDGACLVLAIGQLRPLTEKAMDDAAEVCHFHNQHHKTFTWSPDYSE